MIPVCAILAGAMIWLGIAATSGRGEAWDSPLYMTLGLPLLALASAAFGAAVRTRAWRCGGWLMAGQGGALLLTSGFGNLLPLGVILFALLSLPMMLAATLGAWLARRLSGP